MNVSPYLFFNGRCEEALDFYKHTLGAEVVALMRFKEAPACDGPSMVPPGSEEKVMHASFKIGASTIMASDGVCSGNTPSFEGVSLSITAPDVATAERVFGAVSAGGEVRQPLIQTFFAPLFGMATDKFGVGWMIVAEA